MNLVDAHGRQAYNSRDMNEKWQLGFVVILSPARELG